MTINDIIGMDFLEIKHMTKEELYKTLRYAKQQTDKRITNYYKAREEGRGVYATTIENFLENKKGKFSGRLNVRKSMTRNEMISELTRAQRLFSSKSGTVQGARRLQSEKIERIGNLIKDENRRKEITKEMKNWSEENWKKYWQLYRRKMDEQGGEMGTLYSSDYVQEILAESFDVIGFDDESSIISRVDNILGINMEDVLDEDDTKQIDRTREKSLF